MRELALNMASNIINDPKAMGDHENIGNEESFVIKMKQ